MSNTSSDISKGFIPGSPARDRLDIGRKHLEVCERSLLPVHRSQQNRDHSCLVSLVSLQCSRHLDAVAVVRGKEVGADKQKDHRSAIDVSIDGNAPIHASNNVTTMPDGNQPLPPQQAQMLFHLPGPLFISRSMGTKDLNGRI